MIKTILVTLAMIAFTAFTVNAEETEYLDFDVGKYEGASRHVGETVSSATGNKISVYLFIDDVSFCVPDEVYSRNWKVLANHHGMKQGPRAWQNNHPVKGPTFFTVVVDRFKTEWLLGAVPYQNEVCIMGYALPKSPDA